MTLTQARYQDTMKRIAKRRKKQRKGIKPPFLISADYPQVAHDIARRRGLAKGDWIWVPSAWPNERQRYLQLQERKGYTKDRLIGSFTDAEKARLLA